MKIMIMIIIVLSAFCIAKAQNGDARPLPINWNDTSIFIPKQIEFYLGWQWGGFPRKEVNAQLHTNTFQGNYGGYDARTDFYQNIPNDGRRKGLIWMPMAEGSINNYYPAIQIDPTAPIHSVLTTYNQASEILPPRAGDTTGAIYGFSYRNSTYGQLPAQGDPNFDRYQLNKSGVSPSGIVVLDEPTLQYSLFYSNGISTTDTVRLANGKRDTVYKEKINGSRWYFSINLRRAFSDILVDDSVVMVIKLPFLRADTSLASDTLLFDYIPVTSYSAGNVDTLPFGRGIALKLRPTPSTADSTELVITRRMLPPGNLQKDITISAYVRLKDSAGDNSTKNPELKHLYDNPTTEMVKTGITVRYFGRSSVFIDWFRFEVPYAQLAFRGYLDTSHIGWGVNWDIDAVRYDSTTHPNIKFLSYYGFDDFGGLPMMSLGERYMSRLTSGRWMSYVYGTGQRYNIIKPNNRWVSEAPTPMRGVAWGLAPTPPFNFRNSPTGYAGMTGGWGTDIHNGSGLVYDSLTGSTYEESLYGTCFTVRDSVLFDSIVGYYPPSGGYRLFSMNHRDKTNQNWKGWYKYPDYLVHGASNGPLASYEATWYGAYKTDSTLAFSGQPWWSNVWIGTNWNYLKDSLNNVYFGNYYSRPSTGEEARLQMWGLLINGCKGLMFERMYHLPNMPDPSTIPPKSTGSALLGAMNSFANRSIVTDSMLERWGERLFDSTMIETGGDFVVTGDSTFFDKYLDTNKVKDSCGVSRSRFYLGRLSTRHEVKRVCDLLGGVHGMSGIGDTLMNLRLKSTWYKGFEETSVGDTALFKKYVQLDTTKLRTRPIGRSTYDDADSSFVNVTLLFDTTKASDKFFYIGAQNPRTAPYVWIADTDALAINRPDTIRHSSRPGKVLTFLTTMEYEDYVMQGRIAKYSQSGAREITIPFNYKDTNGRFALLRVKELGGGLDTIVGQDSKLAINFLPGEGKIFRVEIVRPNEVAGELGHSNQTKMCVYPIMRQDTSGTWQESDSIVHYITYYKQIPGRSIGYTGVYFRKSRPSSKHDNSAAIQWNSTEYLLSDSVYQDNYWNWCDTCAYPSIVTRFDSLSEEYRSYIVYGCRPDTVGGNINKQYIVESVVRVANDTVVVGNWHGKSFATVPSSDLSEWGTPMINASDTVNFYCWADPQKGIRVGWKRPNVNPVQLEDTILNIHWSVGCSSYTAQHPSMNPYSRYMRGEHESDCALVWQEKCGCYSGYPDVCYTRLFVNHDGHVVNDLSPVFHNGDNDSNVLFNADTSIVVVSYRYIPYPTVGSSSGTFPVVNRDVFLASADTNICSAWIANYDWYSRSSFRFDKIYWQNHSDVLGFISGNINSRVIWSQDSSAHFIPRYFDMWSLHTIWSSGKYFDQPVVSVGDAYDYWYVAYDSKSHFNCFNYSTRSINLNFRSRPITFTGGLLVPPTNTIYDTLGQVLHFPQSIFAEFSNTSVSIVDYGRLSYPHLAERGSLNQSDWQRNHRIYNKRENTEVIPAPPATIRSSGQYYFRTAESELIPKQFYSFGDDSLNFGISSVILNEHEYPLKEKAWESQFGFMKSSDTVSTDWFNIDNIATMDVSTTGTSPERLSVWLERRSDGTTWDVPLTAGEQRKIKLETVDLINGDNEEYRIQICSYNKAPYRPETAITNEDEEESFGKSADKDRKTIDLGTGDISKSVFIYPNPARDEVNLLIRGNEKSEVIIVSAIGGEATRFFTDGGKTVTVNTSTFPSGMYVVRVKREGMKDAVNPFVILR